MGTCENKFAGIIDTPVSVTCPPVTRTGGHLSTLKYRYCQNFEDITRYLILKYWPILALHGPVKAKLIV